MHPRELAGGDALDVEEADQRGQAKQGNQAPPLKVELARPIEWAAAKHLDENDHDPAAVQREQRQQVREAERHRKQGHQQEIVRRTKRDRLDGGVRDADRPGVLGFRRVGALSA